MMRDEVEEARLLIEEPSGDWDAIEHSRVLIEGSGDEDELERARRRAPSTWSIAAGALLMLALILFCIYVVRD